MSAAIAANIQPIIGIDFIAAETPCMDFLRTLKARDNPPELTAAHRKESFNLLLISISWSFSLVRFLIILVLIQFKMVSIPKMVLTAFPTILIPSIAFLMLAMTLTEVAIALTKG